MAEIGTYYITVMPSMNKFTAAVKQELGDLGKSAGSEFKTSFGDILKGSAIGTMLGNLGSMLGSEIMSGLSTGIRRIDIIQNFPRVMESLGFEAGQAGNSIQLIMDRLDGLPTATQDVVAMTQAFADSTGDLDLATRAALGFNDMMLASGASTGEVTQAQGVLNRVLGKGSATAAQWQSLQSVMPAQLAAVARELGGESMSVEELREALNDGEISWNDFLGAVVKLDTEGSEHIASFRDQAIANSVGIGTALQNVENRIGAGWAEILDSIGRENISGAINDASYGIRDAMTTIGDAITWLKYTIEGSSIDESIGRIFRDVKNFFSENFSISIPDLKNFTRDIIDLVEGGLRWIADNGETVGLALSMIAGALAAIGAVKLGSALAGAVTALQTFIGGLSAVNVIGMGALGLIGALAAGLVYFFTQTEEGQAIWQGFCDLLSTTWEGLQQDWSVLMGVLSQEWESFKAWASGIPDWWQGVIDGWNAKVEGWKQWWAQSWDDAVKSVNDAGNNIRNGFSNAINGVVSWVTSKVSAFKQWWDKSWNDAANSVKKVGSDIHNNFSNAINGVVSWVTNKINAFRQWWDQSWRQAYQSVSNVGSDIKNTLTNVMTNVVSTISEKMTAAKNKVRDMINAIKGLFNFHVTWPHIPLPHFSVSGSANPLDWLTQGVPHISVSWYAKGGVFDGASLIGVGEKGPEAVLPLNDRTMGGIADLIANKMETAPAVVVTGNTFYVRKESDIDAIADAISRRTARQRRARL